MLSLKAKTLDDLLYNVLKSLIEEGLDVNPTKGKNKEIFGACLVLENPRARLSQTESKGKAFSAIGELLWYLSGSNNLDFIEYYLTKYGDYSDDGKTIHGGYGPRFWNNNNCDNQIQNIIDLLSKKRNSRRAVIQLFDSSDLSEEYNDIPCTCTMQFVIREGALKMSVYMRSNDAYIGLPHDIFCFTMLQEIIARELGVELAEYYHFVGSLHLYDNSLKLAEGYLKEGFQSLNVEMPKIPDGSPFEQINLVLEIEKTLRDGKVIDIDNYKNLTKYWKDIVLLLQIHSKFKAKDYSSIDSLKKQLIYIDYEQIVEDKLRRIRL
ncbi:thymidylate synthase [Maribacter sp. 1_2014MBL_MicDiv]|uniref:thymidylate synthase n=1 Tax=Maribacter sp. 1_2014MBL_MicDiv TaxID=1644130 RepID=UPI000A574FB1|nr:thymidylate synthase [Maribacter sp. 1_2014MBL_MicDiv]